MDGNPFTDPVEFSRQILGDIPWGIQAEILRASIDGERIAVRAGHGVGKTWLAARVAVWRWLSAPGAVLLTTAPTYRQVQDLLWREIRTLWLASCSRGFRLAAKAPLKGAPRWDALGDGRWLALGVSAENEDSLQGYHDRELIAVIDEACGVESWVWDAVRALQPTLLLAIGNPTDPDTEFARCFDSARWDCYRIPCADSPNVTGEALDLWGEENPALVSREWIEEVEERYGRESQYYRARVLADFPESGDDSLVPAAWLEGARGPVPSSRGAIVFGVDLAEFGGDSTVVAIFNGPTLASLIELPPADLMETTGKIAQLAHRFRPEMIAVDDTGLVGVSSRLEEQGYPVSRIVPGAKARAADRYVNARAEMAFELREALRSGDLRIAGEWPKLREEARKASYLVTSAGKIQLEPKSQIRRKLGRSPDSLDAVCYGFEALGGLSRLLVAGTISGAPVRDRLEGIQRVERRGISDGRRKRFTMR